METKIERKLNFKGETTYKGVIRLFSKVFRDSQKIIDVGAGSGFFMKKLREKFPKKKIIGVDPLPQSNEVKKGDITQLPEPDNSLDLVVCMDVIEHLNDTVLDAGLREVHRVLNTSGKVIFTTLLDENLNNLACRCPDCKTVFHRIGHVQRFTQDELVNRMKKAGLMVERIIITNMMGYSKYPTLTTVLKKTGMERLMPELIRKLLKKDIVILAVKH